MAKKKIKKEVVKKEDPNKQVEKQFFWTVGIILAIVLAFVLVPVLYHQIFEKFEYAGVKFEKIKYGDLTFYHGKFPIIYQGNFSAVYNLFLRTDPRKNDIPLNTTLSLSKNVRVALNDNVHLCEDMILGQSELGKFIPAFPFVKNLTTGLVNKTFAQEIGVEHIDCSKATKDNTVLIIQLSETPSIQLGEKENCYILNVGDCKYLETVERYIVGAMAQINEKTI